ncbi:hypothetical protein [Bradyrhizobium sp.]
MILAPLFDLTLFIKEKLQPVRELQTGGTRASSYARTINCQ